MQKSIAIAIKWFVDREILCFCFLYRTLPVLKGIQSELRNCLEIYWGFEFDLNCNGFFGAQIVDCISFYQYFLEKLSADVQSISFKSLIIVYSYASTLINSDFIENSLRIIYWNCLLKCVELNQDIKWTHNEDLKKKD